MQLTKYGEIFFKLFLLITFFHLLTSPLRPLLYLGIDRIYLATYLIPTLMIFILFLYTRLYKKLNFLEFSIIFLPLLAIPISILEHKTYSHLLMDIIKPILFISTIIFFKNIDLSKLSLNKSIKLLMNMIFIAGLFSIFYLVYLYTSIGGFYLSATNILFLIPVFYFIVQNKKLLNLISIVAIVYSGKRGVLIAYFFSLVTFQYNKAKNKKQAIYYFVFILISVYIIIALFSSGKLDNILIIKKMLIAIDAAKDKGFIFTFGGRAEEIIASLKIFIENPILIFTGAGPGYTYDLESVFGLILKDVHGVHFSPIGIFTIYGPLFFIILYWYLFKNLKRAYLILKKYQGNCLLVKTGALFVIANFINSFTAFAIFTPIYFAIFIGIINNKYIVKDIK